MYEESSDGKEYFDGKKWHVKKSVAEKESEEFELHNRTIGGFRYINNNANRFHETVNKRSTGHLKDF